MAFVPISRASRYALLVLPLLVAFVYTQSFPGHFFMDDAQIVKANNLVYQLDLKAIFTTDYWGSGLDSGLFRPLTILSFSLNRLLFGIDPWGYLLVNIMLHATVAVLLFQLLLRLKVGTAGAWLGALVFAVHPVHAEPVIELVGRAELLAALFGVLAILFSRRRTVQGDGGTLACFLLALLAKESGIVILALIPLIDWYTADDVRSLLRSRWRLYLGLALVALLWLAYRHFVIHPHSVGKVIFSPNYVPLAFVDTPTRILAAVKLQGLYIFNFLWPFQLQGIYPASTVLPAASWLSWQGGVTLVALLAAGWGVFAGWRRRQLWALFALCYLISFAPTANLFFTAGFTMADRVAYAPSLWFIALLAVAIVGVPQLTQRSAALKAVMLAVLVYFTVAGFVRAGHFESPENLWQRDLAINPRNELARMFLASELLRQERLVEAEEHLQAAIAVAPDFDEALAAYAGLLVKTNRPEEGRAMAMQAITRIKGRLSQAKIPLSLALTKLGRPDEALLALQEVRPPDRSSPWYWEAYGKALEAQGDLTGAYACFQRELEATGERSPDGFQRIGRLSLQFGKFAEAVEFLRRDVRINPQSAAGWNLLGVALAQLGDGAGAQEAFIKAISLAPEIPDYRANLERARKGGGR